VSLPLGWASQVRADRARAREERRLAAMEEILRELEPGLGMRSRATAERMLRAFDELYEPR
jgi:hypothetical protein